MLQVWTEVEYFVGKKCKPSKIYRRMYDVYGDVYLIKKYLQISLTWICQKNLSKKKTVHWMEKHILSGKEKVSGAAVSKEGHSDSLQRH